MKRIGIFLNKTNCNVASGQYSMIRNWISEFNKFSFVDIISDDKLPTIDVFDYGCLNFYPKESISYSEHTTLFQFEDGFNFEKCINYRSALLTALSTCKYDTLICNDLESAFVCYQLGLHKYIQCIYYLHQAGSVNPEIAQDVFKDCYYDLSKKMFRVTDFKTAIHSLVSLKKVEDNTNGWNNLMVLPPILDQEIVNDDVVNDNRDGILFIGRHEERKNPEQFMKFLVTYRKEYGTELKAKIITKGTHVKKFIQMFEDNNYTNYEIKSDIFGNEKRDFISSCKIALLTYRNESFGMGCLEALKYMPVIVLEQFNWHYIFSKFSNLYALKTSEVVSKLHILLSEKVNYTGLLEQFGRYHNKCVLKLNEILNSNTNNLDFSIENPTNRLVTTLQSFEGTKISLSNYFKEFNDKGHLYLTSDIESIYRSAKVVTFVQFPKGTFVGINITETSEERKILDTVSEFFG